jgi:hypothetical protein
VNSLHGLEICSQVTIDLGTEGRHGEILGRKNGSDATVELGGEEFAGAINKISQVCQELGVALATKVIPN